MTLILLLLAPLVEAAACGLLFSRQWMERVSVISAAVNLILAGAAGSELWRVSNRSVLLTDSCMPTRSAPWWSC